MNKKQESEERLEELIEVDFRSTDLSWATVNLIGELFNLTGALSRQNGFEWCIKICDQSFPQNPPEGIVSYLHYIRGSASAEIHALRTGQSDGRTPWDIPEIESAILDLRRCVQCPGFSQLQAVQRCQAYTNLGNQLSETGRIVEAIEEWDKALRIDPGFGMAIGNRGYGLFYYGEAICSFEKGPVLIATGYNALLKAVQSDLDDDAKALFRSLIESIEGKYRPEILRWVPEAVAFDKGISEPEREYRHWCLENRLFLNFVNDIGPLPGAAKDDLLPHSIVTGVNEGPYFQGMFNQIKQEFVSARYLLYEGVSSDGPHFSDKHVTLTNTLDYPCYGLGIEKAKAAFRLIYSLFDKMAFFLNKYFELGFPPRFVSNDLGHTRGGNQVQQERNGQRPEKRGCGEI